MDINNAQRWDLFSQQYLKNHYMYSRYVFWIAAFYLCSFKCYDPDISTLDQPIRLQNFERYNEKSQYHCLKQLFMLNNDNDYLSIS